jgi:mRNA interferase RelE/StbE
MNWKVEFDPRAWQELLKLDKKIQIRILKFIKLRLAISENPRLLGASLKGNLGCFWKYRIGDYRLVCQIEDKKLMVLVIRIGHRKDIYKKLN